MVAQGTGWIGQGCRCVGFRCLARVNFCCRMLCLFCAYPQGAHSYDLCLQHEMRMLSEFSHSSASWKLVLLREGMEEEEKDTSLHHHYCTGTVKQAPLSPSLNLNPSPRREWRKCPAPDPRYQYVKLCGPALLQSLFKVEINVLLLKVCMQSRIFWHQEYLTICLSVW